MKDAKLLSLLDKRHGSIAALIWNWIESTLLRNRHSATHYYQIITIMTVTDIATRAQLLIDSETADGDVRKKKKNRIKIERKHLSEWSNVSKKFTTVSLR